MSWQYVLAGQQSLADHFSNKDLARRVVGGFREALGHGSEVSSLTRESRARDVEIVTVETIDSGLGQEVVRVVSECAGEIQGLRSDFHVLMGDLTWKVQLGNEAVQSTLARPHQTAADEERKIGQKAYRDGLYEEALRHLKKSERLYDLDFSVHRSAGNIYLYHRPNLPKALEHFQKAARYAKPENRHMAAEGYYFAAFVCFLLERVEDAFTHLKEAVECDPGLAEAQYELACVAATLKRTGVARESLYRAIDMDPRYWLRIKSDLMSDEVRSTLASLVEGALEEAIQGKVNYERAIVAGALGRADAATESLRQAIDLDPQCHVRAASDPMFELVRPDVASLLADMIKAATDSALNSLNEVSATARRVEAVSSELQAIRPGAASELSTESRNALAGRNSLEEQMQQAPLAELQEIQRVVVRETQVLKEWAIEILRAEQRALDTEVASAEAALREAGARTEALRHDAQRGRPAGPKVWKPGCLPRGLLWLVTLVASIYLFHPLFLQLVRRVTATPPLWVIATVVVSQLVPVLWNLGLRSAYSEKLRSWESDLRKKIQLLNEEYEAEKATLEARLEETRRNRDKVAAISAAL